MADQALRDAERHAALHEADLPAARGWLLAARRSGDPTHTARALSHLSRLGDAEAYEALCHLVPWPGVDGPGGTRRLRQEDPERELLGERAPQHVALSQAVVCRYDGEGSLAVRALDGASHWQAPGRVWLTPTLVAGLEPPQQLALRDPPGGELRASIAIPTHEAWQIAVEGDRALVADRGGGAVCLDLLGGEPGRVVWDSRAPCAPALSPVARPYDTGASYREGELLAHPTFGEGRVAIVVDRRKVIVDFAGTRRQLAHGARGEAVARAPVAFAQVFRRVALAASVALLEEPERVVALDARDGTFLWATEGKATLGGADARGVVLGITRDPKQRTTTWLLVELDPRSGQERWCFPSRGVRYLALGEELVLATRMRRAGFAGRESERELVALDRQAGAAVRWRQGFDPERVAVTPTRVLFPDPDQRLDLATGRPVGVRRRARRDEDDRF